MALDVRPSPLAGRWYDADPEQLARRVDGYVEAVQVPDLEGEIVAVIVPHAGHMYSGPVAAYAFAPLRSFHADLVAIVSPMHHPYQEPLLTTAHEAYGTPLGHVRVNKNAVGELDRILRSQLGFGLAPVREDPEHSLEIELPFLQRVLASQWELLPVMVRGSRATHLPEVGEALAHVLGGRKFLMVASTDLSHFYNQQTALAYDRAMLSAIESFAPEEAFDLERAEKGFACGLGAFTAVLWAARDLGADRVRILRHATSASVTGDYSSVVGYGAAVVLKTAQDRARLSAVGEG